MASATGAGAWLLRHWHRAARLGSKEATLALEMMSLKRRAEAAGLTEALLTLRIKQLKDVLKHLDIEPAEIVEKKDLVALVVKHRK